MTFAHKDLECRQRRCTDLRDLDLVKLQICPLPRVRSSSPTSSQGSNPGIRFLRLHPEPMQGITEKRLDVIGQSGMAQFRLSCIHTSHHFLWGPGNGPDLTGRRRLLFGFRHVNPSRKPVSFERHGVRWMRVSDELLEYE